MAMTILVAIANNCRMPAAAHLYAVLELKYKHEQHLEWNSAHLRRLRSAGESHVRLQDALLQRVVSEGPLEESGAQNGMQDTRESKRGGGGQGVGDDAGDDAATPPPSPKAKTAPRVGLPAPSREDVEPKPSAEKHRCPICVKDLNVNDTRGIRMCCYKRVCEACDRKYGGADVVCSLAEVLKVTKRRWQAFDVRWTTRI